MNSKNDRPSMDQQETDKVDAPKSTPVKNSQRQPVLLALSAFLCAAWLVFLAIVAFAGV